MTSVSDILALESRTAELVGALSLATDVAAGFPAETAIRTSILAARSGARSVWMERRSAMLTTSPSSGFWAAPDMRMSRPN